MNNLGEKKDPITLNSGEKAQLFGGGGRIEELEMKKKVERDGVC